MYTIISNSSTKPHRTKRFYRYAATIAGTAAIIFAVLALVLYIHYNGGDAMPWSLSRDERVEQINVAAETILGCHGELPGLSLSAVKDGTVYHAAGYGYADVLNKVKADEYTVFGIASITKSFAAVLVYKVLGDRNLTRNTKLRDIFGPTFHFHSDQLTKYATVGDLLSHQLGIPSYSFIRFQKDFSREDVVRKMPYLKEVLEFRNSFLYSNLNYALVGRVTEILHGKGKTWEDLVWKNIFRPLGMTRTFLTNDHVTPTTNVSVPYLSDSVDLPRAVSAKFLKHWGQIGASGSIMTPAVDSAKWMHAIMHNGKSMDNTSSISARAIRLATRGRVYAKWGSDFPVKPQAPESAIFTTYGSGFRQGTYKGYHSLMHTGSTLGYTAIMMMIPDLKIGVFISFNGYDVSFRARFPLAIYVLDHLLGDTPWLNTSTLCSYPKAWIEPTIKDKLKSSMSNDKVHDRKESSNTKTRDAMHYEDGDSQCEGELTLIGACKNAKERVLKDDVVLSEEEIHDIQEEISKDDHENNSKNSSGSRGDITQNENVTSGIQKKILKDDYNNTKEDDILLSGITDNDHKKIPKVVVNMAKATYTTSANLTKVNSSNELYKSHDNDKARSTNDTSKTSYKLHDFDKTTNNKSKKLHKSQNTTNDKSKVSKKLHDFDKTTNNKSKKLHKSQNTTNNKSKVSYKLHDFDKTTNNKSKKLHKSKHTTNNKSHDITNSNEPPFTDYVGIYGTFAYGNISIHVTPKTGKLVMRYGSLICALKPSHNKADVFLSGGVGDTWFYNSRVTFNRNVTIHSLTIPSYGQSNPSLTYPRIE